MRAWLGTTLIVWGIRVIPANVRELVRGILLYHVPGALTDEEKADVIDAKSKMRRRAS